MQRDAVAGVVDDLCHVLGVDVRDVVRIEIRSGTVEVLLQNESGALWPLVYSYALAK